MHKEFRLACYKYFDSFTQYPVFYPNRAKTDTNEVNTPQTYYRLSVLPINHLQTMLQVDVLSELGDGDINILVPVEDVLSHFQLGQIITDDDSNTNFVVIREAQVSQPFDYNARYIISISIILRLKSKC